MNNVLKLYTYWNELQWDYDFLGDDQIVVTQLTLWTGEKVTIDIWECPFSGDGSLVITFKGDDIYMDFETIKETKQFLMDLQKQPNKKWEQEF